MANRKKLLTSAIALGTAAALTLGGTFAWQSISQEALNESSDVVNPGGRLHNDLYYTDLNTTDSNVYVENFTEEGSGEDIFARVRLEEYMEVVLNHGTPAEQTMTLIGSREDTTETDDDGNETIVSTKYNYKLFDFNKHVNEDGTVTAGLVTSGEGDDAVTESRFTWTMGGKETDDYYFMPTFNKNKDSLAADLNGLYVDRVGGISKREEKQYEKHTAWAENATTEGFEIYDTDSNMIDELEDLDAADLNAIIAGDSSLGRDYEGSVKLTRAKVTHTAKAVAKSNGLISMADWLAKLDEITKDMTKEDKEALIGNYWVYDTDGWVYWSSPIKAGEATGLLLDSFTLTEIMDNTWYYAINVVGQFCTADDTGWDDKTGFFADGESITDSAKTMLETVGVDVRDTSVDYNNKFIVRDGEGDMTTFILNDLAKTGYKPGKAGTGATAAYNHYSTDDQTFTFEFYVPGADEDADDYVAPVLSLVGNDTYTIEPYEYEAGKELIKMNGSSIGSWKAATGELRLYGSKNLNGVTLVATVDGIKYELELYLTQCKDIVAVFSNSDIAEGAYDLTFYTGDKDASPELMAAYTGVDADDIVFHTTDYNSGSGEWPYGSDNGNNNDGPENTEAYLYNTLSVRFANTVKPQSLRRTFDHVGYNFDETDYYTTFDFTNLDTSDCSFMNQAFCCSNVETLDLSTWDLSRPPQMSQMFESSRIRTLKVDGGKWNTSKVYNMSSMFKDCKHLTLDCSDWDVSTCNAHGDFSSNALAVTEPSWN